MAKELTKSRYHAQVKHKGDSTEYDPIAAMVVDRFMRAKEFRARDQIGDASVEEVLHRCHRQYNSITDPCDVELESSVNTNVKISLTKHKTDVLVAWMRDLMTSSASAPFLVEPTPIVDLSDRAKAEVVAKLRNALVFEGFEGTSQDIQMLARQFKEQQIAEEFNYAKRASNGMQRAIEDQLVEGNFRRQQMDFLANFALYPYAVLCGPMPEMIPVFKWSGNKPIVSTKAVLKTYNISPFDYYWSPDTYEAGKGTYDIVKIRMTKAKLLESSNVPGYIRDNVIKAVKHYSGPDISLDWLSGNPDQQKRLIQPWGMDDSIDLIKHFGALSGRELRCYGMTGVEDDKFYECEATVLGSWTIRLLLNPNPNPTQRPVYVSSYQRMPGKLAGYGIAQNLRDIERSFMAAYRGMMENVSFSSAPLGEVDFTRIQRYLSEDQIGTIMAGTVVPTDPDMSGGGRPAHYYHTVPNNSGSLMNVMQYFSDLADRHTGIPAAMSGQPVGTGVNRTFRGVMALYGNALKGVQSALINIDKDIFEPLGKAYFAYNMKYSKDSAIKGDAMVRARGTEGLLQKEIANQGALETLQLIAQLSQTGQVDPKVLRWAINRALEATGVPLAELGVADEPEMGVGPGQEAIPNESAQTGMGPDGQQMIMGG